MKELRDDLRTGFAAERESIPPDENVPEHGTLDSMGLLKLVTFPEERFGFEAGDAGPVPHNLATLEKIRNLVERKSKS